MSALAIDDLVTVSGVPVTGIIVNAQPSPYLILIIYQTTHERQVPASASALAVASVVAPEEISLSSPNIITQANLRDAKSEQNPSVSYGYEYVLGCN